MIRVKRAVPLASAGAAAFAYAGSPVLQIEVDAPMQAMSGTTTSTTFVTIVWNTMTDEQIDVRPLRPLKMTEEG